MLGHPVEFSVELFVNAVEGRWVSTLEIGSCCGFEPGLGLCDQVARVWRTLGVGRRGARDQAFQPSLDQLRRVEARVAPAWTLQKVVTNVYSHPGHGAWYNFEGHTVKYY